MKLATWFRKHVLRRTVDGRHRTDGVSTMQQVTQPRTSEASPLGKITMKELTELTSKNTNICEKFEPARAEKKLHTEERQDYKLPERLVTGGSEVEEAEISLKEAAQPEEQESPADYMNIATY